MDYSEGLLDTPQYKLPNEVLDTDFKVKYPPDPRLGTEADDGARVWKVYHDEAMANDSLMLDGWNKTLDILLIFAALFSAVVTTFVIESTSLLQPDSAAYSASALYAIASASMTSGHTSLPPPPEYDTAVSSLSRWVNRLWYTSLAFSLFVAFLCILAKQWITEYTARNNASSGSPRHWARRHELYFQALNTWPVADFISVMPLMLHFALFLFFAGLSAFLWPSDQGTAIWIAVLTAVLVIFYVICTFLPFFVPERPTATPLLNQARKAIRTIQIVFLRGFLCLITRAVALLQHLRPPQSDTFSALLAPPPRLVSLLSRAITAAAANTTEKQIIDRTLEGRYAELDADALQWLILSVPDSDAVAVGWQALGGLHPDSLSADRLRRSHLPLLFAAEHAVTRSLSGASSTEAVRVVRTMLCLCTTDAAKHYLGLNVPVELWELLEGSDYPDMELLYTSLAYGGVGIDDKSERWYLFTSPSLASTAKLLLCVGGITLSDILRTLLSCDFAVFTSADWRLVFRLLRDQRAPSCSLSDATEPDHACKSACFLEAIAALGTMRATSDSDQTLIARLADRLILPIMFGPNEVFELEQRGMPSLIAYMGCPAFIKQKHAQRRLGYYVEALCLTSPHAIVQPAFDDQRLTRYLRALTSVIYCHTQFDATELHHLSYMACCNAFASADGWETHVGPAGNVALALELVFLRPVSDTIDTTLWKMLGQGSSVRNELTLLALLSSALTMQFRKGHNIESLANEFLEVVTAAALLDQLSQGSDMRVILGIALHCQELHPSWWQGGLDYAGSKVNENSTIHDCAVALESELQALRSCSFCPLP